MKKYVKILLSVSLILIIISTLAACGSNKLTMKNYNKIECAIYDPALDSFVSGMTLKQVTRILGSPTRNYNDSRGTRNVICYVWETGEISITVTFENDMAIMKTQIGL